MKTPVFRVGVVLVALGFKDQKDYQQNFLWRIGNMALPPAALNASLGNSMPFVKAPQYINPLVYGGAIIKITEKIGKEIISTGSSPMVYRFLLEARCAEMALFALERFFPKCISPTNTVRHTYWIDKIRSRCSSFIG
jgi:hypothetical protein